MLIQQSRENVALPEHWFWGA